MNESNGESNGETIGEVVNEIKLRDYDLEQLNNFCVDRQIEVHDHSIFASVVLGRNHEPTKATMILRTRYVIVDEERFENAFLVVALSLQDDAEVVAVKVFDAESTLLTVEQFGSLNGFADWVDPQVRNVD